MSLPEILDNEDEIDILPGLMPRETFRRRVKRSEYTLRRWEAQGKLVIIELGNLRLVDVPATLKRLREGKAE
jgi:hypothetical protein